MLFLVGLGLGVASTALDPAPASLAIVASSPAPSNVAAVALGDRVPFDLPDLADRIDLMERTDFPDLAELNDMRAFLELAVGVEVVGGEEGPAWGAGYILVVPVRAGEEEVTGAGIVIVVARWCGEWASTVQKFERRQS